MNRDSFSKRRYFVGGAAAIAVLMSVAALGVPAGWYGKKQSTAAVISQPSTPAVEVVQPSTEVPVEVPQPEVAESTDNAAALAARHQRDREKAAREERL